jgi:choline dehydrogenase-like flavoprotein
MSDFLQDLPLTMRAARQALRALAPAMLVLHLWHAARPNVEHNSLSVSPDGELLIRYTDRLDGSVERQIIKALARIGFFSLPSLVKFPLPGNSFHYAGTLPMRARPGRFETWPDGRVQGTGRVYAVDGSVFPALPAKNLSFTIMANAMRVAEGVARTL